MAKVVGVVNNKGGVGKTLTSRVLAEFWAFEGRRVLCVDHDSQCNLSQRYLLMARDPANEQGGVYPPVHPDYDPDDPDDADWDGRSSIADIYYGEGVIPYPTYIPTLEIAPGYEAKLIAAEHASRAELEHKVVNQLRQWLHLPEVQERYDVIVIDSAPSKSPLTQAVLRAATHIVIPTTMQTQSVEGLYGMIQAWSIEHRRRDFNDPLTLAGIIPNLFDRRTNNDRQMLGELRKNQHLGKYITENVIGQKTRFREIDNPDAEPMSVHRLPPTDPAYNEARAVCEEVDGRIFHG